LWAKKCKIDANLSSKYEKITAKEYGKYETKYQYGHCGDFTDVGGGLLCVQSLVYTGYSGVCPQSNQSAGPVRFLIFCSISISLLASLVAGRRPQCSAGHGSRECTPSYLFTGISNLLQAAQAGVVLGQRSTYLASWSVPNNSPRVVRRYTGRKTSTGYIRYGSQLTAHILYIELALQLKLFLLCSAQKIFHRGRG
jgi:hypothetical protein